MFLYLLLPCCIQILAFQKSGESIPESRSVSLSWKLKDCWVKFMSLHFVNPLNQLPVGLITGIN